MRPERGSASVRELGSASMRELGSASMRERGSAAVRERGSASMLVVTMTGVLLFVTIALVLCAGLVRAHRMAQSAADLAALAGARALTVGADGCAEAASVATANGAALAGCDVQGEVVHVTVTVPGPAWPGLDAELSGAARAGPS
ncbi:Rv3654c family TadE-like protein [Nocardioides gilvus]|uniref:Rv3654c family TadE-like protein n=1 Tax=Nocardioides gilvus TaxID=1735589 RepID=UPI001EF57708|nr:Rv3654c family TadE-like protein [Nocardioides gilvus]